MGENNYKKILFLGGFIILAGISCWATSESFRLLLPSWPTILCWLITIAFFIIASLGTKLIVDSLNKNLFIEKRGVRLIGGIIILLFFWLVCSMPTNTHTFFYRNYINQKVNFDISQTQGYLAQIKNNINTEKKIQSNITKLENAIQTKLGELKSEIFNDANPGFGPKAKEILASFADLLGVAKIEPLTYIGTSAQDRQKLYDAYRKKILTLQDSKKENIKNALTPTNTEYRKIADVDFKNLESLKKYVADGTLDLNEPEDIKQVCDKIEQGYSTIRTYKEHVEFQNENDKIHFTAANPQTKVRRMLNVYDVWVDFINGEFPGSFIFWIIISILVDIAAFIFFDLAFTRDEY